MPDICTVRLWLAVNDGGDFFVSTHSANEALSELNSECKGDAMRVVKVTMRMVTPSVHKAEIVVPAADNTEAQITVEVS